MQRQATKWYEGCSCDKSHTQRVGNPQLENSCTTEVLPLEWKVWILHQDSQPGDLAMEGGASRESDFEGQHAVSQGFHRTEGNRNSTLRGHQESSVHRNLREKEWLHKGLGQDLQSASFGGFGAEAGTARNKKLTSGKAHCSVQFSYVWLLVTPWTAACQASLSITNSWSLLKLMSIESVMASNHFILCHPLLLPSIFPSIRIFSSESALHITWPKYWRFSFTISPSNGYSGLISFRIDCFDFLAIQGTLKSLQQSKTVSNTTVQKHQFFSA